jgi:hypothetical protein
MKRKGLRLVGAVSVLALILSATNSPLSAQSGSHEPNNEGKCAPIEGSWIFTIDVIAQGFTFNSLISFTAGGVVLTSASLPPPATAYGSWERRESNRVNAVFYAFLLDPTAKGVAMTMNKVNLLLHLTGRNELAGTAVGSTCDLQGENCVNPVDFQFTGKRIVPENSVE